ncbi:broad specificity phosphatase PhoE [Novosphingobium chloroacetimidivorans]|uniref:Broad specificity phosphatase PhoE n=1 Tax=Novosphingobium chloroacetimidivorans TaxID=1428314 RepID=A0A7W7KAN6_9SPHN|nr:histidine phosphatase family protein [Novosphingobium chloroacetimidivorans]MBB4859337.1 broad specificity phosphatase PhoE [Novosphingobium chloroacetimidivorans]
MTATILLIRHAAHSHLGRILSGRTPDIALSSDGLWQASALADRLGAEPIAAIHTSPVQRAQETARTVGERHDLDPEVAPALDELDFGDWSGRAFVELEGDPRWSTWNEARSTAVAPNGESMADAQARAWQHIQRTALASPGRTIAMVSHCDVIRAVVADVLGLSLDHYGRFEIDPASVTRLAVGDWGAKVLSLNETYS